MGSYNSMVEVVDNAKKEGTQILSFKSTRAVPLVSYMEYVYIVVPLQVAELDSF